MPPDLGSTDRSIRIGVASMWLFLLLCPAQPCLSGTSRSAGSIFETRLSPRLNHLPCWTGTGARGYTRAPSPSHQLPTPYHRRKRMKITRSILESDRAHSSGNPFGSSHKSGLVTPRSAIILSGRMAEQGLVQVAISLTTSIRAPRASWSQGRRRGPCASKETMPAAACQ